MIHNECSPLIFLQTISCFILSKNKNQILCNKFKQIWSSLHKWGKLGESILEHNTCMSAKFWYTWGGMRNLEFDVMSIRRCIVQEQIALMMLQEIKMTSEYFLMDGGNKEIVVKILVQNEITMAHKLLEIGVLAKMALPVQKQEFWFLRKRSQTVDNAMRVKARSRKSILHKMSISVSKYVYSQELSKMQSQLVEWLKFKCLNMILSTSIMTRLFFW